jgi:hypothetical protein
MGEVEVEVEELRMRYLHDPPSCLPFATNILRLLLLVQRINAPEPNN